MYSNDENDQFTYSRIGGNVNIAYPWLFSPYLDNGKWSWAYQNISSASDRGNNAYFCPSANREINHYTQSGIDKIYVTAGINALITHDISHPTFQMIKKTRDIQKAGKCMLFMDDWESTAVVSYWPVFIQFGGKESTEHWYPHSGAKNVAYVDGHVAAYRALIPQDKPMNNSYTAALSSASAESKAFYLGL
jgi:prepilin-type processing-associated H-X9-DG protein